MHDTDKNEEQSRDISAVPVQMGCPFCFYGKGTWREGTWREGKDRASNK